MQQLFFERAIRCAVNQTVLVAKYFKVLAQAYMLADSLSENVREMPTGFRAFLESLEKQSGAILEMILPTGAKESVKQRLEQLVETIGRCMHKQKEAREAKDEGAIEESAEEGRHLRNSILELVEVCKMMTQALAQQVIESKATLDVLEESLARVKSANAARYI